MHVQRDFTFEAAHHLPEHPGKCRNVHGHSYRLRVVCDAPIDPTTGLAIDFAEVKRVVHEHVLEHLDHADLNTVFPIPSAELIAVWIWERLKDAGLPIAEVHLGETALCSVVYRGENSGASAS